MISWQYNGVAPWSDIADWCRNTFGEGKVNATWDTFYFKSEKHYMLFLLRWSSC